MAVSHPAQKRTRNTQRTEMKFILVPTWQIGRTSAQKSFTAVASAHKHTKGDEKSGSNVSKSIKRVMFGIKDDETRLVPCRPVDEEREKREYCALLKKRIAEREKLQKVR